MIEYLFVFVVSVFSLFFGMWFCLKKYVRREEREFKGIEENHTEDSEKTIGTDETIVSECDDVVTSDGKSSSVLAKLVSRESYTELACEGDGVSEEEYIRQRMREQDKKYGQK